MNNPTLDPCCEVMIGRADIEESKSNVDMNSWLPQASYPFGNFSDISFDTCDCVEWGRSLDRNPDITPLIEYKKGSIGHAFAVGIRTENANERSFCPFARNKISRLMELLLGHLCCRVTDVPPQPNSPPVCVCEICVGKGGSILLENPPN